MRVLVSVMTMAASLLVASSARAQVGGAGVQPVNVEPIEAVLDDTTVTNGGDTFTVQVDIRSALHVADTSLKTSYMGQFVDLDSAGGWGTVRFPFDDDPFYDDRMVVVFRPLTGPQIASKICEAGVKVKVEFDANDDLQYVGGNLLNWEFSAHEPNPPMWTKVDAISWTSSIREVPTFGTSDWYLDFKCNGATELSVFVDTRVN